MRLAAEEALSNNPAFHSISGSAENTGLPAKFVNLVTAATAFHLFDQDKAKVEFRRILQPGGYVALIWNVRRDHGSNFSLEYEQLLAQYGTDYSNLDSKKVAHREIMASFLHRVHFLKSISKTSKILILLD